MKRIRTPQHNPTPLFLRRIRANHIKKPVNTQSFLRKQSRIISSIGALIVLATFVTKEGLAERWREDASALDMAALIYTTHVGAMQALTKANLLRVDLRDQQKSDDKTVASYLKRDEGGIEKETLTIRNTVDSFPYLQLLLDRFPHLKNDEEEMRRLKFDSVKLISKNHEIYVEMVKLEANEKDLMKQTYTDPTVLPATLRQGLEEAWFGYGRFVMDASNLAARVVDEGEVLRKRNEERATWAWRTAAALYILGWALAAIGRLYELPLVAEP